jgi:hypothetical protein
VVRGFQISMVAQLLKKTAMYKIIIEDGAMQILNAEDSEANSLLSIIQNVAHIMFVMTEICSNVL